MPNAVLARNTIAVYLFLLYLSRLLPPEGTQGRFLKGNPLRVIRDLPTYLFHQERYPFHREAVPLLPHILNLFIQDNRSYGSYNLRQLFLDKVEKSAINNLFSLPLRRRCYFYQS